MDSSHQLIEQFLEDDVSRVLVNPRLRDGRGEVAQRLLGDSAWARGHLFFSTSGTTGEPKWIGLSRQALFTSATMVNDHLECSKADAWARSIPAFHVGGAGIVFRALLGQAEIHDMPIQWEPALFAAAVETAGASLLSLVPTQLHDLVEAGWQAPGGVRAVLVGGAALDGELARSARNLGWPVLTTYGLTEAASQVATQPLRDALSARAEIRPAVLEGWSARVAESGCLEIRGEALYSSVLTIDRSGEHEFLKRETGAWHDTGDLADFSTEGRLEILGRSDLALKILGERVLLDELRRIFSGFCGSDHSRSTLAALPDERRGHRIVAVFEKTPVPSVIHRYNESTAPFERIIETREVEAIPRTALGKIREADLRAILE